MNKLVVFLRKVTQLNPSQQSVLREHFITTVPQLRSSESRLDPSQQSVLWEHFITMTRSSGSGMRDLPCASDGSFCPGFSRPGFSRPGFRHQLLHAFATGQEERNKPESSAAKALLLTSSGAREQESKRENGETLSLLRRIILCLERVTL